LLRHLSTRVFVLPGDRHARLDLHGLSFLGDRPLFCALEEPIHGWGLWLKRMEDIVVAAFAIVVLSPVLLLTALAIRLDSPGPIFFRQVRAGFNGKTFLLWKFRTMFAEATDPHAKVQTIKNDPRVTRIGRFLRRMSIDELPQLFNVIEGTMSLVGPRPHALLTKTQGKNLEELVDYYAVRHRVRPGMTGWAQVHGFRGELDSVDKLQSRVDYDLDYINRWTIWLDLKILFKTAALVLRDCRAY
jgi:polysaccharide biosynthesis protein PslA